MSTCKLSPALLLEAPSTGGAASFVPASTDPDWMARTVSERPPIRILDDPALPDVTSYLVFVRTRSMER